MDRIAEQECIARFQAGDESAFDDLFQANQRQVTALALRFAANETIALDIAQEVFLLAFQELRVWRGEARLSTWLHRTTLNIALTHIRQERRQQRMKDVDENDGVAPAMDDITIQDEIKSSIDSAVKALPPRQHSVFTMRRYAEMDMSEIATRLKISEAGAKASYWKAILALRVQLRTMARC